MKGSEKQIKWANDLIAKMEASAVEAKVKFQPYANAIDKWIESVKNTEFASTIIGSHQTDSFEGYAPVDVEEWRIVLKELRSKGEL